MFYALHIATKHTMLVSFLVSILPYTLNTLRTEVIFVMSSEPKTVLNTQLVLIDIS